MKYSTHTFPVVLFLAMVCAPLGVVAAEGNGGNTPNGESHLPRDLVKVAGGLGHVEALAPVASPDMPPTTPKQPTGLEFDLPQQSFGLATNTAEHRRPEDRALWRLEWDNDAFVHTDNGFTNGWSLQRHSPQFDNWHDIGPSRVSSWIARTVPGLGDGEARVVKRGAGLSQVMMTPEDISNPNPQPGDVPWAGALGWAESWYAFDNRSLNAFQIYAGILGPYSMAEDLQVQIHDWINADDPSGWDNQLKTEPLLNLNYAYKRKLVSGGEYMHRFGGDLAMGGQVGLGNFSTFAELSIEGRFGWGLPRGFAHQADPPGRGIIMDPNEGVPGKLHVYASVAARVSATAYSVFLDGNTFNESPHPGLRYDTISRGTVVGLHAASGRYSAHFNFYSYENLPFESVNPLTNMTWGNITFEYRF